MLNRSTSLAMSTSILKALPGKLDIKRHSPCILYFYIFTDQVSLDQKTASAVTILQQIIDMSNQGAFAQQQTENGPVLNLNPDTIIVQQEGEELLVTDGNSNLDSSQYVIQYVTQPEGQVEELSMVEVQTDGVETGAIEVLQTEVQEGIQTELQEGIQTEIQEGIQTEVQEGIQTEVQEGIQAEVHERIQTENQEGIQAEIQEGIQTEIQEGIQAEVQGVIQTEVQEGIQTDLQDGISTEVQEEIQTEVGEEHQTEVETELETTVHIVM